MITTDPPPPTPDPSPDSFAAQSEIIFPSGVGMVGHQAVKSSQLALSHSPWPKSYNITNMLSTRIGSFLFLWTSLGDMNIRTAVKNSQAFPISHPLVYVFPWVPLGWMGLVSWVSKMFHHNQRTNIHI
jgi:hypothetical protein